MRHALRQLAKSPWYSATVIIALGLGIGATTAIYSVVDRVLLRPLSYAQPERLFFIAEAVSGAARASWPANARHFTEWRERSAAFQTLSAIQADSANLTGSGDPERLEVIRVSSNWCETLGVQPALGRGFAPGEDTRGQNHVVILSDAFWRRKFHANAGIIGASIRIDSQAYTVVGVLPPQFQFPDTHALLPYYAAGSAPDIVQPLVFSADELRELMGRFNYGVIGRLKPAATPEAAAEELTAMTAGLVKQSGEKAEVRAMLTPLQETIVGRSRAGLLLVLGAIGSVLLIICVNLANLSLVRAERRAPDIAVRMALGASRARLLGDILTETLVLALIGGTLGIGLAEVLLRALIHAAPADIPRLAEVHLDVHVLGFAIALTLVTGLGFGLFPAWRATRIDPHEMLKAGGRSISGSRQGRSLRHTLVGAEVGLSAMLLMIAALLLASFGRLLRVDQGFSAPTVLAGRIGIPWTKYQEGAQRNAFYERLMAELAATPGVASVAITNVLPLQGETWIDGFAAVGDSRPLLQKPTANVRFVSSDYFKTMGIMIRAGRTFAASDRGRDIVVVSARVAEMLWPGQDAVGRAFTHGGSTVEVVGVVGDVRADLQNSAPATIYHPYWDWPPDNALVVVRALSDPRSVAGAFRAAVHRVDREVPVPRLHTMQDVLDDSVAQRRFQMILAAAFAGTSVLLATLGIYAVVAYTVARRRHEMAIRSALGAHPLRLLSLVVRQGLAPVGIGLLGGIACALATGRILSGLLYQTTPYDPTVIGMVAAILVGVASLACAIPAFRTTRISPVEALRTE